MEKRSSEYCRGELYRSNKPTCGIGVPGSYVPSDPGASDTNVAQGSFTCTGRCSVKAHNLYLRDIIISGVVKLSFVVSHEIGIDEAPEAYTKFDRREDGYTKVLIHPSGPVGASWVGN
ncbi:hypothetical protein OCU04_007404 [Sclerotinia nivalis]|uniref:Uncharacterized protein n=1 Tax=Sclerotinia nivalis TaxID=352851 RepID=A0A9X0AIN6_9HELO|nr:hypothetical protein OCU04_007404 [Sclerotinia nivalis]